MVLSLSPGPTPIEEADDVRNMRNSGGSLTIWGYLARPCGEPSVGAGAPIRSHRAVGYSHRGRALARCGYAAAWIFGSQAGLG